MLACTQPAICFEIFIAVGVVEITVPVDQQLTLQAQMVPLASYYIMTTMEVWMGLALKAVMKVQILSTRSHIHGLSLHQEIVTQAVGDYLTMLPMTMKNMGIYCHKDNLL
jgi:hypothetical protein